MNGQGDPGGQVLALGAAVRDDDHLRVPSALQRLYDAERVTPELAWLVTELARYFERAAWRDHPGVRAAFEYLDLQGDAGAISRRIGDRLRSVLLRARSRKTRLTAEQAEQRAGELLLEFAAADFATALEHRELRQRLLGRVAVEPERFDLDGSLFDRTDPIAAIRDRILGAA